MKIHNEESCADILTLETMSVLLMAESSKWDW